MAGLFLALAGVAYALAERGDRKKRREGIAIAAAAFLPPVFLAWAFPEGGYVPFPFTAYLPIPLFAIVCLIVLPRRERALRWGAVLYGVGATLALFARHADGRQRGAARRALRRARAALRDLGTAVDAAAPGRCRCSPPASRRSRSGSGRPPCAT